MSEGSCHVVSIKVLGKEPGDVGRILAMLAETLSNLKPEILTRGNSWLIASFKEGLVTAQVEAYTTPPGSTLRVECIVRVSGRPDLIARLAESLNASASRLGYPVLLELDHDRVKSPPGFL
ncbi:MAG: hypothetical protein F7B95_02450 [Desulfurococcales archaeon]|nr:hypothetical protein [Desulfurococcales archaeon]